MDRSPHKGEYSSEIRSPLRGNYSKTSIPEVPQEQNSPIQLMNPPSTSTVLLSLEHMEKAVASTSNFSITNVHTHGIRGGKCTAHISLRFGNDDVHLWCKHTAQGYSHTEAYREWRCYDFVVATKVDWHKCQPDYTCGVHGEGNVLRFVEICRYIACLEGIVSATHYKQTIIAQRGHNAHVAGVADKEDFSNAGVGFNGLRRLHDDEGNFKSELDTDQDEGNEHLSPSTHEPWLPGTNFLFAASQNAGNAVGFGYEGRVTHGSRQSHKEPLEVAGSHSGTSNEGEGTKITQEDPCENDVAELPAGGLDHRCVTI